MNLFAKNSDRRKSIVDWQLVKIIVVASLVAVSIVAGLNLLAWWLWSRPDIF